MKTLFTFDIGNSHPHVGVFQDKDLIQVLNWKDFKKAYPSNSFDGLCIAASQVGAAPNDFDTYRAHQLPLPELSSHKFKDMPVAYGDSLGKDRLYQAYYAFKKYPQSSVALIDAGTFITLDHINDEGFRGGYIYPGLSLFFEAYQRGALLPELGPELTPVQSGLPKSTDQAITEAAKLYLAQMIQHFIKTTNPSVVLLTGGSMNAIENFLPVTPVKEPHLIHKALFSLING